MSVARLGLWCFTVMLSVHSKLVHIVVQRWRDQHSHRLMDFWWKSPPTLSSARLEWIKKNKNPPKPIRGRRACWCEVWDDGFWWFSPQENSIKYVFWIKWLVKIFQFHECYNNFVFLKQCCKVLGFIWLKFSLFHRFICDWNKIVKLSPLLFANFDQVFIN